MIFHLVSIKKILRILIVLVICRTDCPADEGPILHPIHQSYSLQDSLGRPLDLKLIEKINQRNGIFIEVGAHDGITQSNTKVFEEFYDWVGILIEPSPSLYSKLCTNRPKSHCFQCALGSFDQDNTFFQGDFDGHLMSSIGGKRRHHVAEERVLIRSLQSILEEVGYSEITLISLDTEGYELNILHGIDFNKTIFDYMLIEIYKNDYQQIIDFLSEHGYEMVENFSNYNLKTNPSWDGTHNDYLFKRRN